MSERPTRVMLLHNLYQQPGGEDQVFTDEGSLLEARGHAVSRYTLHNDQISDMGRLAVVGATVWNGPVYREIRALIRSERPQVAHFHNTFPLISPAAYHAARAEGVPVVQTLHNYRLICPNALFFREGGVCEDCSGKTLPWPGIAHACYRGSRTSSAVVATALGVHRMLGTWRHTVNTYVALTDFSRGRFIQGGLPAEKIVVKPNFVQPDPGVGRGQGSYFLYVGRLSQEKGLETLLAARKQLGEKVRLKIVGDGPLGPKVAEAVRRSQGVEWLGRQPKDRVLDLMKNATALVFPSVWYEGFPMVIVEALAVGLPIIASDLGNMRSLIDHGRTGLKFRAHDPGDLAGKVEWATNHPVEIGRMRREARKEFESKYTAEANYRSLSGIYEGVVAGPETEA
ncbi:glycosyltransferase family 4 protein [Rubrobacter tropicus]|nr:glycosyltransferase family 4 protein [Rubrobacter tropicus]